MASSAFAPSLLLLLLRTPPYFAWPSASRWRPPTTTPTASFKPRLYDTDESEDDLDLNADDDDDWDDYDIKCFL
ncbi:hypothetical protein CLU79DRAFT_840847 [Phycomyces nitens]|nr:hypothetical protein CLU79DRAFT_840847 [Phycomyces nitens]